MSKAVLWACCWTLTAALFASSRMVPGMARAAGQAVGLVVAAVMVSYKNRGAWLLSNGFICPSCVAAVSSSVLRKKDQDQAPSSKH
jgi:hypothetical protein